MIKLDYQITTFSVSLYMVDHKSVLLFSKAVPVIFLPVAITVKEQAKIVYLDFVLCIRTGHWIKLIFL